MKQAILITAYRDFDQLLDLVALFDDRFGVYIHIDKKSNCGDRIYDSLKGQSQVQWVSSDYTINWGGRNHLLAILSLCKKAFADGKYSYFHLITGQDLPIKPFDTFFDTLVFEEPVNFLEHFPMPAICWNNGGMERLELYNFYDVFNAKSQGWIIEKLKSIQRKIAFKRNIYKDLPPFYGGSTYWSLHQSAIEMVLDYTKKYPKLLRQLKHTFCSEEFYFQTILLNSPLAPQINNYNLRYIDWKLGEGGSPSILIESDFEALQKSPAFFARKFDIKISRELINRVKAEIL